MRLSASHLHISAGTDFIVEQHPKKIFLSIKNPGIFDLSAQYLYKYRELLSQGTAMRRLPSDLQVYPKKTSWRKQIIHSKRGCPKLSWGTSSSDYHQGECQVSPRSHLCNSMSSTMHKAISGNFCLLTYRERLLALLLALQSQSSGPPKLSLQFWVTASSRKVQPQLLGSL